MQSLRMPLALWFCKVHPQHNRHARTHLSDRPLRTSQGSATKLQTARQLQPLASTPRVSRRCKSQQGPPEAAHPSMAYQVHSAAGYGTGTGPHTAAPPAAGAKERAREKPEEPSAAAVHPSPPLARRTHRAAHSPCPCGATAAASPAPWPGRERRAWHPRSFELPRPGARRRSAVVGARRQAAITFCSFRTTDRHPQLPQAHSEGPQQLVLAQFGAQQRLAGALQSLVAILIVLELVGGASRRHSVPSGPRFQERQTRTAEVRSRIAGLSQRCGTAESERCTLQGTARSHFSFAAVSCWAALPVGSVLNSTFPAYLQALLQTALAEAAMARDEDSDFGEEEEEYADSEVRNRLW